MKELNGVSTSCENGNGVIVKKKTDKGEFYIYKSTEAMF